MNSSSQQNQYPPYDPSHYNYHQQQQNLPYYNTPSNYSNSYVPQQQWHHPPGQPIGLNPVAAVVVAALAQQLTQFSTCYPQPQPVISGPAFGSPAFSGHGSGPSGLVSHAGQSLDKGGGQHSGGGRDIFSEVPPRTGGSGPSSRKKGHNHGLGGLRCELCKVDCATMGMVKHHVSSKRHRNYLNNLKANANRTVCDFQTKENPSGYLKQETTVTPDNLLVDEKTKQNLPENIPLDTVPTENKLENEHKINNAQLTDSSKRGQHSSCGRDIFSEVPPITGGSGPSSRRKGHNRGLGGLRCELCKVDCGSMGMLEQHESGKRHRKNLKKLEANANTTVSDFRNKENPSGDLKQETTVKPDNLLVDEKTRQNLPVNIPLDTVPTENKLENEHKINNAQLTDSSKRGQHSGCGKDIFGEVPPRTGGSGPSSRRKGHNRGLGGLRCELCKVDCGSMGMLEQHESGKRHRNNLKKLEANADTTVSDFRNKENPSGDLKQESTVKPYNLLVDEKTKQNLPGNISLDIVPTGNKLENEHKINNAQQADLSKDADRDLLSKKPMMNQLENQSRGLKRGWLVVEKKKNVPKVKRQLIEPPKPEVVIPLMCDLCNVKCDTREILTRHRLSKKHMSKLKCFDVRLGLQALYPPNPVTHTLYHLQGVQQVLNGAQASDPTVGSLILPRTDNAGPP